MSSLQELVDPWWQECDEHPVTRGQLVHAFIPDVGLTPYVLDAEGRSKPTNHDRALFTIRPLRVKDRHRRPLLPVAALPQYPGEVWATYRSKIRPCLVLSVGGDDVPAALRPQSSPRWQSAPTLLVAPYYGAARTDQRSGWHAPFLERIRACEYPQFLMDSLPLPPVGESVLRLDHLQPIGRHHDSYSPTRHTLTQDALDVLDEWLEWPVRGTLCADAVLADIRSALMSEAS